LMAPRILVLNFPICPNQRIHTTRAQYVSDCSQQLLLSR